MPSGFLPDTDSALLAWSANFNTLIAATPTAYGLAAPQATIYTGLHDAYAAALTAATEPTTRTPVTISAKNVARTQLKGYARVLAKIVEAFPAATDPQKVELGLNVRKQPTPIPPPEVAPSIDVKSITNRTVTIRLHNDDVLKRAKPPGVAGASVFSFVGETPPTEAAGWTFAGSTTRTEFDVPFNNGSEAETVWITAFWYNPRGQSGPAKLPPVQVNLPAAAAGPGAVEIKIAA